MELIVSLLITVIGEVAKKLSARFGEANTKKIVLGTVFVGSVVYTLLTGYGILTEEMISATLRVALASVGIYEMLVKRVVYPALKG